MNAQFLTDDFLAKASVVGSEPREGLFRFIHPHRLRLRGVMMESRVWLKARLATDSPKPFLIYARPRSGTTLLVDLLDQVQGVRCDGELLHSLVMRPVGFLRDLPKRAGPDAQAYGVKVLSYQLMEVQRVIRPLAFFESLAALDYSIIHLARNTWDQTLSLAKAHHSGVYCSGGTQAMYMRLDPEKFVALLRWNDAMLAYEKAVMSEVPHMSIVYETHLEDATRHQSTVEKLCHKLGVDVTAPVRATQKRTGGYNGSQKIENMDELLEHATTAGFGDLIPAHGACADTKTVLEERLQVTKTHGSATERFAVSGASLQMKRHRRGNLDLTQTASTTPDRATSEDDPNKVPSYSEAL